jgi:hypothetical protein
MNALRGNLAEIGGIAAKGQQHARNLATLVDDGCEPMRADVMSWTTSAPSVSIRRGPPCADS